MIQTKEQVKLDTLLALTFKLDQKTWLSDENERKEILEKLLNYAQIIGFPLAPDDPEFLPKLRLKILEEYQKAPELPPANLPPPGLNEAYDKAQQKKEIELQKKIVSQKTYQDYQRYVDFWKKRLLKNQPELPPKLSEAIAEKVADKTITNLPPVAQTGLLTENDLQRIQKEESKNLENELKNLKIETKPQILQEAEKINEWQGLVKKMAAEPKIIQSVKETTQVIQPTETKNIPPLSQEVLNKLNQPPEEVSFLPLYTVLHPKVAAAFIEKAIYTLPAKFLNLIAENASPEWQAMMQKGLFVEDIQASIKALKAMGVPETHPLLKRLSDKTARLQEQQKFTIQTKDGQIIYKDTLAARIFKHYYRLGKITGRDGIYDDDLKTKLPRLSPDFVWSQGGYAGFLRNRLNNFKFIINTYERISKFVTHGKYTSFLTPVRQFFSQKITQPVVKWLAKTAVGKAVKTGAKKAATWLATRLGIEAGATAVGAAAGGVPGVVVAAVSILFEALKFIGKKFIGFVQKIVKNPEYALGSVGLGVLLFIFIPKPLALIGVIPIVFGGIGLLGWATAPATLSGAAGGIGAFFTAISTLPFAAPIALFIVILFSALAVLTLFVVLVVSGAFILPKPVQEAAITTVSPYTSEYFDVTKTATPNHLENEDLKNSPEIKYRVIISSKGKKLKIISIDEEVTEGEKFSIIPHNFKNDLGEKGTDIEPGGSWSTEYTITARSGMEDSLIVNSIEISVGVENETGIHVLTASAMVTIGNPPMECPSGYPTEHGQVSQGPFGATSHRFGSSVDPNSHDQIAIDITTVPGIISFGNNIAVKATHNGTLKKMGCSGYSGCGVYIYSPCGSSKNFYTAYWHLLNEGRHPDGRIDKGNIIGYTNGWQNHLHYEFGPQGPQEWPTNWRPPIEMKPPYFPQNVPYFCSYCGIKW